MVVVLFCFIFFFFNDTATTDIYTLSLHDALPIWLHCLGERTARGSRGRTYRRGTDTRFRHGGQECVGHPGARLCCGSIVARAIEGRTVEYISDGGGLSTYCPTKRLAPVVSAVE